MDTQADAYWVTIDDNDLAFRGGTATIELDPAVPEFSLFWWVLGTPGAQYVIDLDLPKLKIERSIASGKTKSAGTRKFTLNESKGA